MPGRGAIYLPVTRQTGRDLPSSRVKLSDIELRSAGLASSETKSPQKKTIGELAAQQTIYPFTNRNNTCIQDNVEYIITCHALFFCIF